MGIMTMQQSQKAVQKQTNQQTKNSFNLRMGSNMKAENNRIACFPEARNAPMWSHEGRKDRVKKTNRKDQAKKKKKKVKGRLM